MQACRLQKRLIHRLSQAAEAQLPCKLERRLPCLQAEDDMHPATKRPGCFRNPCRLSIQGRSRPSVSTGVHQGVGITSEWR